MKTSEEKPKQQSGWKKPALWGLIVGGILAALIVIGSVSEEPSGQSEPYKLGEHAGMVALGDRETSELRSLIAARGYVCPPPAYIVHNLRTDKYEVLCNSNDVYDVELGPNGELRTVE